MNPYINLILIVIALILAISRIAFNRIKKRDREQGLYLPDRNYTMIGTARLLFMKEDKRVRKEQEKAFDEILRGNKGLRKQNLIVAAAYCGVLLLIDAYLLIRYGMNIVVLGNAAMIIVAVSYMISKSLFLTILILLYAFYNFGTAISSTDKIQIVAGLAGVAFFVLVTMIRVHAKREQRAELEMKLKESEEAEDTEEESNSEKAEAESAPEVNEEEGKNVLETREA